MIVMIKLSISGKRKKLIKNHMVSLLIEENYDKIWLLVGNMKVSS